MTGFHQSSNAYRDFTLYKTFQEEGAIAMLIHTYLNLGNFSHLTVWGSVSRFPCAISCGASKYL